VKTFRGLLCLGIAAGGAGWYWRQRTKARRAGAVHPRILAQIAELGKVKKAVEVDRVRMIAVGKLWTPGARGIISTAILDGSEPETVAVKVDCWLETFRPYM
jgi:hypothetical protein